MLRAFVRNVFFGMRYSYVQTDSLHHDTGGALFDYGYGLGEFAGGSRTMENIERSQVTQCQS